MANGCSNVVEIFGNDINIRKQVEDDIGFYNYIKSLLDDDNVDLDSVDIVVNDDFGLDKI